MTPDPPPAGPPISDCTCWDKAPTVPVFRSPKEHLEGCPLKGSGKPVGLIRGSQSLPPPAGLDAEAFVQQVFEAGIAYATGHSFGVKKWVAEHAARLLPHLRAGAADDGERVKVMERLLWRFHAILTHKEIRPPMILGVQEKLADEVLAVLAPKERPHA